MKKTFLLEDPRHQADRVVAGIKHELRKYLKRERRKKLPEDVDFWDFDCRIGRDVASAVVAHVEELIPAVDTASKDGWSAVYVEILAKPGRRAVRPRKKSTAPESADSADASGPAAG